MKNNKIVDGIVIILSSITIIAIVFCVYKACNAHDQNEQQQCNIVYFDNDSSVSVLKKEIERLKTDVEILKRKKSKLIINCCNSDTFNIRRE